MKALSLLLALFLCPTLCCAQSVMVGKRLISQGDSTSRVREIAGTPDKVDKIPGDATSPPMEIWTYRRKENIVVLFVVDSKVVHTQEKPADTSATADAS